MTEQIDIAKEWLSEFCKSSQDGEVCAFTIKQYLEQLESDKQRFDLMDQWTQGAWEQFFYGGDNRPVRDRIDAVNGGEEQP